jgi:hypothetical protein
VLTNIANDDVLTAPEARQMLWCGNDRPTDLRFGGQRQGILEAKAGCGDPDPARQASRSGPTEFTNEAPITGQTSDFMDSEPGPLLSPSISKQPKPSSQNVRLAQRHRVVRAAPDGYTLLLVTSANTINSTLYANLEFNFNRDIAPIGMIADLPFVMLVNPQVPAKSVAEFIAYARANPGKLNVASRGNGTAVHILGELFKMRTGIDLMHVPYRGDYMADLLGGQVQVAFGAIADCVEQIGDGKLRALGVTSSSRHPQLTDVPAIVEFLPGYEATGLVGIGGPPAISKEISETLNREINVILGDSGLKSRLLALGWNRRRCPLPLLESTSRSIVKSGLA